MNPPPENSWDAWSPGELHARLGHCKSEWYVVGGWALDLWHGHQTREHEDLEFAVLPDGIDEFRKILSELVFFEVLGAKPSYFASNGALPENLWQLWGADVTAGFWRIDVMVERGTSEVWAYKRDRSIRMPRAAAVRRNELGVPYRTGQLLLFKAKHRREKDERDFDAALPKLNSREKLDLRIWLEALHPEHDWIARL